ncbi:MAG: PQQ-binding-like beta-propeller repeat protein, partial [Gemmataceae bacterium]
AGGAGYTSPVKMTVGQATFYLSHLGKSGGLVGIEANTGKLLFRYTKVSNGTANIPTPIVKDDLIFVSTGYGDGGSALLQVSESQGEVKIEEKKRYASGELQNHHGGMLLVGEHIYMGRGHNNGIPTCVNMTTAEITWQEDRSPAKGSGSAAAIAYDDRILMRYENGIVALFVATPKEFQLISHFAEKERSGEPCWAHPALAQGQLFLRDQDKLRIYSMKAK